MAPGGVTWRGGEMSGHTEAKPRRRTLLDVAVDRPMVASAPFVRRFSCLWRGWGTGKETQCSGSR